jgi:hypothetical protein
MVALLGLGVVGVQLVILASMLGAAMLGRFWLKAACLIWVAFTLFGSIFTLGLLLLQLVTIVIGYLLGKAICDRRAVKPQAASKPLP